MTALRVVWVTSDTEPGPQSVLVDPPLAPGEVEIDPQRAPTKPLDEVALAALLESTRER